VPKAGSRRLAPTTVIVASIALACGFTDVRESFAGCGGYCDARQAREICHRAIARQDLKAHERDGEFERCKTDPVGYLAEPVLRGTEIGLE
jgi:hypothetical protein